MERCLRWCCRGILGDGCGEEERPSHLQNFDGVALIRAFSRMSVIAESDMGHPILGHGEM
jgi:hypothetical protein